MLHERYDVKVYEGRECWAEDTTASKGETWLDRDITLRRVSEFMVAGWECREGSVVVQRIVARPRYHLGAG